MFDRFTDKARDFLYLNPQIYFDCNHELVIENCRKIEECSEVLMQFISGRLRIRIWGSCLRADDFSRNGIVVHGNISGVEFIERGNRKNADTDKKPY